MEYHGEGGEQLALIDYTKADAMREKADEWVAKNAEAWKFIREQAEDRTARKRRFGIGELCEQVRWHMYAKGVDSFKVNNTIRAALARKLIAEYPPCREFIETRSSVMDI